MTSLRNPQLVCRQQQMGPSVLNGGISPVPVTVCVPQGGISVEDARRLVDTNNRPRHGAEVVFVDSSRIVLKQVDQTNIASQVEVWRAIAEVVRLLQSGQAIHPEALESRLSALMQLVEKALPILEGPHANPSPSAVPPDFQSLTRPLLSLLAGEPNPAISRETRAAIIQTIQSIPLLVHEGLSRVVAHLFKEIQYPAELQKFHEAIKEFKKLSNEEKKEVLKETESLISARSQEASQSHKSDAPKAETLTLHQFEKLIQQASESKTNNSAKQPTYEQASPNPHQGPNTPAGTGPDSFSQVPHFVIDPAHFSAALADQPIEPIAYHPFQQIVEALPQEVAAYSAAFFQQLLSKDQKNQKVPSEQAPTLKTQGEEVSEQVQKLVQEFLSFDQPVFKKVLETLMRSRLHPNLEVRKFLVELLEELVHANPKQFFENGLYEELKRMARARDRRFFDVQVQALKVILDLEARGGNRRQKEREELLEDVNCVGTMRRLLMSHQPEKILEGLGLFSQVSRWIDAKVRQELLKMIFDVVTKEQSYEQSSDDVIKQGMGLLLLHLAELESEIFFGIFEADRYDYLKRAHIYNQEVRRINSYNRTGGKKNEGSKAQQSSGVYRYSN